MVSWQEDLSIGVLEIDIQHKLLFEKFDAFLAACDTVTETDEIYRLFWFLEAYAITHFQDEEKLMQQVGFPDYLRHHEKHLIFTNEVARMKVTLKKEGPTHDLVSSLTRLINCWLVEHISSMDRAIGRFVVAAGIPAIQ